MTSEFLGVVKKAMEKIIHFFSLIVMNKGV